MKILDKIRKFAEADSNINYITVSPSMLYELLVETGASTSCRDFRFAVQRTLKPGLPTTVKTSYAEIRISSCDSLYGSWIKLNGKYPRNIDHCSPSDYLSGGDVTPVCDHSFVNVGFTSIKLICKHCDMEK